MRTRFAAALAALAVSATAWTAAAEEEDAGKIKTTSEVNQGSLQGAATAPLRDLNVLRTKIPPVLLEAQADPYARPPKLKRATHSAQCAQLVSLIAPLDEALGGDIDTPAVNQEGLMDRGRETAFGAMASFASDAIPFRGWVRKLTGAERHDHFVQQAITSGAVRRAYLKGLGEAHGCNPPATPSHVLSAGDPNQPQSQVPPPPTTQAQGKGPRPRYPIR